MSEVLTHAPPNCDTVLPIALAHKMMPRDQPLHQRQWRRAAKFSQHQAREEHSRNLSLNCPSYNYSCIPAHPSPTPSPSSIRCWYDVP